MYYGGSPCGCGNYMPYPSYGQCGSNNGASYYAIVLVLFILLVIVIGSHFARQKKGEKTSFFAFFLIKYGRGENLC